MSDTYTKTSIIQSNIPLAVAVVFASIISGFFVYLAIIYKSTASISVTGLATRHVKSDEAVWSLLVKREVKSYELAGGYTAIEADKEKIIDVLKKYGLNETVDWSPITNEIVYNDKHVLQQYDLAIGGEITTGRIDAIENALHEIEKLNMRGINAQTSGLEYNYSKLQELRISLLSEAMRDAKTRAEKILEDTGQHIGRVINASVGSVQVLGKHSDSTSDYNSLDTSSIEKDIVITVRSDFSIK
ncbi:MAG: SIMPL domain-containing protein [Candidatus Magasanikbacteria bacterium]|nr:SIMPL domain-containing protein [Candidatus Magasanikbacteria bacterium]